MDEYTTENAVLIVAFNRPLHAKSVLDAVRRAKPRKLYVAVDGPRDDHPEDAEKVNAVKALFDDVGWECEVHKRFSDINLGCCDGPYTAFSWVFENEDAAILLEDDCVPAPSFFRFCDEMLNRFSTDERVMIISGTNVLQKECGGWKRADYSYHFSRLGGIHGWATWKRAWKLCDLEMKHWDDPVVKQLLKNVLSEKLYQDRSKNLDHVKSISGKKNMWDYQWGLSRLANSGLAVVPCDNQITNIGFGLESTNTPDEDAPTAKLPIVNLTFPLVHPSFVIPDVEYDEKYLGVIHGKGTTKRVILFEKLYKTGIYQFLLKFYHLLRDGKWH